VNMVATISVFGLASVASLAGWSLFSDVLFRRRHQMQDRVDRYFGRTISAPGEDLSLVQDISTLEVAQSQSKRERIQEQIQLAIDQSGLTWSMPRFVLMVVMSAGLGGFLMWTISHNWMFVLMASICAGVSPVMYLLRRRKKRLHRMLQQMPDVFDLICRAVRAGNTFWHGVNSVSDEFEAPISTEFAYCHEMHNLGLPSELALREMARRTGLVEMKLLAEAVTVQQQAGGNLVEVLDKLTLMIRERFRIHGKIRTLTAEGKMQAWVLLALAPAVFLLTFLFNPNYAMVLIRWNHSALLGVALALELVGAFVINKVVQVDF